jgi:hypothetical protein
MAMACHKAPTVSPAPACPTTPVRAAEQADLDALRGCTSLAGLSLRGAVPFDLEPLSELARIEGDLNVRSTFALGSVRLPALVHVGGHITISSNYQLGGIYLTALTRAASLTVSDAPGLIELMLPALVHLDGDLRLARLPSLELIDLSALPAPGGALSVERAPNIETWIGPTAPQSDP